ncbi:hypothetical protein [Streptomyces sp. NPDC097610]|uniref:hypothetical protein n=1 Tax=Streptomyces sp. NPDC097610 TaxID=3157227 RepID=UPI0033166DDD
MFATVSVAVATPPRASPVFTGPTAQHDTAATTASAPTAAQMMFFRMARKSARSVADTGPWYDTGRAGRVAVAINEAA